MIKKHFVIYILLTLFSCSTVTAGPVDWDGAEKYITELTRVSAETGREIADGYNNTVIVAGCIGPTGELMEPMETFPTLSQSRYFISKPRV